MLTIRLLFCLLQYTWISSQMAMIELGDGLNERRGMRESGMRPPSGSSIAQETLQLLSSRTAARLQDFPWPSFSIARIVISLASP